jgi:hypothetical protein
MFADRLVAAKLRILEREIGSLHARKARWEIETKKQKTKPAKSPVESKQKSSTPKLSRQRNPNPIYTEYNIGESFGHSAKKVRASLHARC